jgi:hypothetical protein
MPWLGFEPAKMVHAFGLAATVIGEIFLHRNFFQDEPNLFV